MPKNRAQVWLEMAMSEAPGVLRLWRLDDNKACLAIFSLPETPEESLKIFVARDPSGGGRTYIEPNQVDQYIQAGADVRVMYVLPVYVWKAGWQVFAGVLSSAGGRRRGGSLLHNVLTHLNLLEDAEAPLYIARTGKGQYDTTYTILPGSASPLAQHVKDFLAEYKQALSTKPSVDDMLKVVRTVFKSRKGA